MPLVINRQPDDMKLTRQISQSAPEFLTRLSSLEVNKGSTVKLTVLVAAYPPADITWTIDDDVIFENDHYFFDWADEENTYTLNIEHITRNHEGVYRCIAANELGTSSTMGFLSVKETRRFRRKKKISRTPKISTILEWKSQEEEALAKEDTAENDIYLNRNKHTWDWWNREALSDEEQPTSRRHSSTCGVEEADDVFADEPRDKKSMQSTTKTAHNNKIASKEDKTQQNEISKSNTSQVSAKQNGSKKATKPSPPNAKPLNTPDDAQKQTTPSTKPSRTPKEEAKQNTPKAKPTNTPNDAPKQNTQKAAPWKTAPKAIPTMNTLDVAPLENTPKENNKNNTSGIKQMTSKFTNKLAATSLKAAPTPNELKPILNRNNPKEETKANSAIKQLTSKISAKLVAATTNANPLQAAPREKPNLNNGVIPQLTSKITTKLAAATPKAKSLPTTPRGRPKPNNDVIPQLTTQITTKLAAATPKAKSLPTTPRERPKPNNDVIPQLTSQITTKLAATTPKSKLQNAPSVKLNPNNDVIPQLTSQITNKLAAAKPGLPHRKPLSAFDSARRPGKLGRNERASSEPRTNLNRRKCSSLPDLQSATQENRYRKLKSFWEAMCSKK